jgi:hypothetical protein
MREYSSREMPEGFLDKGVAAFFDWAVVGVEELGKERILRTSAADAPDIVVVVVLVHVPRSGPSFPPPVRDRSTLRGQAQLTVRSSCACCQTYSAHELP